MGRIPQDVIDRVLGAHDIVDVVGRSVRLEKKGTLWKGLCPFHEEKTPSFTVSPERQTFKCFGTCAKGGNIFGFLMERDGLKFPEAVRALAAEKGIAVPSPGGWDADGRASSVDASRTPAIRAALTFAQEFFARTLWGPTGDVARAYLEKRGYPPRASKELGLGLSPAPWEGLVTAARAAGIAPAVLEEAGLARRSERGSGWRDMFHGRVMFPIADVSGRVVTFGARTLGDDQPKYLNGPETPVFKKGRTLYGLDRAKVGIKKVGYAILMEGYTDVLMAHLHGFSAAVAGMGTAFTTEQARVLTAFTTTVVVLYDGDAAGLAAAEKTLDVLLEQGLEVKVALLPTGRDVDEVLLEDGVEALDAIVRGALDVFDFKVGRLAASLDLTSEYGRATAAIRMAESLVRVKSPLLRDTLFSRLAGRLAVSEAILRDEAGKLLEGRRLRPQPRPQPHSLDSPSNDGPPVDASPTPPVDPHARSHGTDRRLEHEKFVAASIYAPELGDAIRSVLPASEIDDAGLRALYGVVEGLCARGLTPSPEAVARLVADDADAARALAGLPEGVPFADWVPDRVRQARASAKAEAGRQTVLQLLAGPAPSAQHAPPAAATSDS